MNSSKLALQPASNNASSEAGLSLIWSVAVITPTPPHRCVHAGSELYRVGERGLYRATFPVLE